MFFLYSPFQAESMAVQAERQVSSAPDLTELAATATLPGSLIYPLAAEALSSPLLPPGGGDIACGEIRVPKVQVDLARMYSQDAHDPIAREAQVGFWAQGTADRVSNLFFSRF
jgi:hypothetical protein